MKIFPAQARRGLTALSLLICASLPVSGLAQTASPAQAAFTDSAVTGLGANRRVAITSVIVSFQSSVAATKQGGSGMFADKTSSQSVLAMPVADTVMQQEIAEQAYSRLKADLTAAGYEVLSEGEVTASPVYQQITKTAGFPNPTKFGNALGDAMLVSPAALTPYLPYAAEGSQFEQPKSYIGYLSRMGGASTTPGGPSMVSIGRIWALPSQEVQLAKALNAHVVKATYVVTLGETATSRKRTLGGYRIEENAKGQALAQVGLLADQTRISFRTADGNAKWQKVSYMKPAPAKDGDVVVRLAQSIEGGTDHFSLRSSSSQGGLFNPGADFQFRFFADIKDPEGYAAEVNAMIADADKAMVELVRK
ncbi:MAG: hypothetical protein CFE28_04290 [Alphaproteobacteria bacterium PA2]|nr:MAG: hypothetical protein CFE28_04290 [Alphaproteobacteria bacterium PA2]